MLPTGEQDENRSRFYPISSTSCIFTPFGSRTYMNLIDGFGWMGPASTAMPLESRTSLKFSRVSALQT